LLKPRGPTLQSNPFVVAAAIAITGASAIVAADRLSVERLQIGRISYADAPRLDGDTSDRAWRDAVPYSLTTSEGGNFDGSGETRIEIRAVHEKISLGFDITTATKPVGKEMGGSGEMAMSNKMADRDEDFNTRYASYRGWQMAIEKVKPIPRTLPQIDLTAMVKAQGLRNTTEVVDYFCARFLSVSVSDAQRKQFVAFLNKELATSDIPTAETYMEDPLRMLLHLIMSTPEYQLG